ncbi:MAG: hypothetical protein IPK79_05820 [Vampirovibrionales bacterium]|nr:hypothetical protein [Vampirovibrionales bacterium]
MPVVSEETCALLLQTMQEDEEAWKKSMVHRLKEENPEINTLLLTLAQKSKDPKSVIMAGYLIYSVIELSHDVEER